MKSGSDYNPIRWSAVANPSSRFLDMKRWARTISVGLVLAFVVFDRAAIDLSACPNCKEAVSLDAGETTNLSNGFNWSVVLMLTVPFSMLGTGAFMVRRAVRLGTLPEM
jgi:hypothetical protein